MDKDLKSQVLRLFLQFIQLHVPLSEALMATLGGQGREAAIWQELGIPGTQGWLIERNKKRSVENIKTPYRYTSSLGNFSYAFRSVWGSDRGVDAFHLDLCGTIESSVDLFRRTVPLVVKSRGRCLAITVADARRNLSVERFSKIEPQLVKLLGFRYDRMRHRLAEEQGHDRELAVTRELGFFYHLISLFKFYGRFAFPNKVVRYAYVSHYSGVPFPMRTYFFHFPDEPLRVSDEEFARGLYREWFREPLHDLSRTSVEEPRTKETSTMSEGLTKLKTIAEAAGGDVLEAYRKLVASARENGRYTRLREGLKALLGEAEGDKPAETVPSSPTGRRRRNAEVPQNGEVVEAQLRLLEARSKGKKAYDKVSVGVGMPFVPDNIRAKAKREKKAKYFSRALYAQTQKGNRPAFIQRLAKHNAALINDDLAQAYTQITGKTVTVDQLRAEAGL